MSTPTKEVGDNQNTHQDEMSTTSYPRTATTIYHRPFVFKCTSDRPISDPNTDRKYHNEIPTDFAPDPTNYRFYSAARKYYNEIPTDFALDSSDYDFYNELSSQVGCSKVEIAGIRISIEEGGWPGYGQGIQTLYKCTYEDGSTQTKYAQKHLCLPNHEYGGEQVEFILNEKEYITKVSTFFAQRQFYHDCFVGCIIRMKFVTNQGREFEHFDEDVENETDTEDVFRNVIIDTISFDDDGDRIVAFAGASRILQSGYFFVEENLLLRFGCYAKPANWRRWKMYILLRKLFCTGRASQVAILLDGSESEKVIGHILSDKFPENMFQHVLTFL